jgi:hypothetical protein
MGTAILGTVLFVTLNAQTATQVEELGVPQVQAQEVADIVEESAGTVIPSLAEPPGSPQVQAAASQAFADAVQITAYVAGGFVFLGLLATLALPKPVGRREDEDSPGHLTTGDTPDPVTGG